MRPEPRRKARTKFDVVVVSGTGIDTNIYLHGNDIDFSVEANFSQNVDYVGQAGGYSARGFARLGKNVALLDYVGDDYHGAFIRRELRNDGINVDGLLTHSSGTRRSVNFMYKDGRRKNFYDAKGAMEIRPDLHISQSILRKTKLAHFNIINFSRYVLPSAQELGLTISCDLQDIISADDEYRREYVEAADILFFSAANHADPSPLMLKLLNRKSGNIIIAGMGSRDVVSRHMPV